MKELPVPVLYNKKPTVSADGSIMFYSMEYQEAYRAKSVGAYTESRYKFVEASGVLEKAKTQDVRILDLCFGLGYNCAVTFDLAIKKAVKNRIHIVSIEKDETLHLLVRRLRYLWPLEGYRAVRTCLDKSICGNLSMESLITPAREALERLSGKFDAVYFDPFSPSKNPEMWRIEVFSRLKELMAVGGVLVTYACGKTVQANMSAAGFKVNTLQKVSGAFQPGLRARLPHY